MAPSQAHELCAGDGSRWIISLRQLVGYKLSATIGSTVADAIGRALHTDDDVVAVSFNKDVFAHVDRFYTSDMTKVFLGASSYGHNIAFDERLISCSHCNRWGNQRATNPSWRCRGKRSFPMHATTPLCSDFTQQSARPNRQTQRGNL